MKRVLSVQLAAALVVLAGTASAVRAQHSGPWSGPGAAPCTAPCYQEEIKKICRPEVGTKKTTKYWYDCKCVDLCVPKCSCCPKLKLGWNKGNRCEPCPAPCEACHDCDCPRVVKKLIKYPKIVEECDYKCVPACVVVPKCCPAPCYGHPGHGAITVAPGAPAKSAELLPPPKVEKK